VRPAQALACVVALMGSNAGAVALSPQLDIESVESPDSVRGEIRAMVDYPFDIAGEALRQSTQWCEILILHINVKSCRASGEEAATRLHVAIGSKSDESIDEAYPVDFAYRVAESTVSLLRVTLRADTGPLGTHDYLIVLDAQPASGGRTLVRLTYSYSYGMVARLAMQVYLATIGRDKVGFTVIDTDPHGVPRYIGGMRGVTERNTMRYYLAIDAFLGALAVPPKARLEKSMRDWFAGIERYPRQLHEMEQGEYLAMKRGEYARQQPKPL
jgi:hypothetical protein